MVANKELKIKLFDYGEKEMNHLISADPILGSAILRLGHLEREVIPPLFPALIYNIVSQLVSLKSAETVWTNMASRLGDISPENLASFNADEIQKCGMTMKKARCILEVSEMVLREELDFETFNELSDDEIMDQLTKIKGIGRWTAEMILILSMERPDVLSFGDLAIRRGMEMLYGIEKISKVQFQKYKNIYSPYGSVASIYLWEISHLEEKNWRAVK